MKKYFAYHHPEKYIDAALLLVRLSIGPFMLTHGIPKLLRFFGEEPARFSDPLGLGIIPSLVLVVFAEVFCSILLTLGLLSRWAVLPLIVAMSVAAFVVHGGDGFGSMESALMYLVIYVFLLVSGPGTYSLDYLIFRRK